MRWGWMRWKWKIAFNNDDENYVQIFTKKMLKLFTNIYKKEVKLSYPIFFSPLCSYISLWNRNKIIQKMNYPWIHFMVQTHFKQDSIEVGCVPRTCQQYSGGWYMAPIDRMTDAVKHYLPASSLAGGNNILKILLTLIPLPAFRTAAFSPCLPA